MLNVKKKTGFKIIDLFTPVVILDSRNKPFYDTTNRLPRVTQFNLPPGKYNVDNGKFLPLEKPVKFKLPKLPEPQRHYEFPFHFRNVTGDNPNKCSIYWNKGIILWDITMLDLTLPELYFILYHEFSHARYEDEDLADLGAAYIMLRKGFNPSQVVRSPITSLSGASFSRKMKLYNRMLRLKYES